MADTGKYGCHSSGRNSEKEKPAGNGFHFQGKGKKCSAYLLCGLCTGSRDILAESGIDGMVPRPFFLSNLALAIARTKTNAVSEMENESILNGMHFLCAEDNELNAEILQEILGMYGASCTIYPDGEAIVQAFQKVKPGEYDVILMDVQMPKMNGLEATRAIRNGSNPLGKTIPIIAMTANAFSEDVQHCISAGMDAHIAKPLDIAVLERTLRGFAGGGGQIARWSKVRKTLHP